MGSRERRWKSCALALALTIGLALPACQSGYDAPPTPCDRWCQIIYDAGCSQQKPADCVAACESDSGGAAPPVAENGEPACDAQVDTLFACYAALGATLCPSGSAQWFTQCIEEFKALISCRVPSTVGCLSACAAWAASCNMSQQACFCPYDGSCLNLDNQYEACTHGAPIDCDVNLLKPMRPECLALYPSTAPTAPAADACRCPAQSRRCAGVCVDTYFDADNCGDCGIVCPSRQTCQDGSCAAP
jgi:hypothetical protein